MTFGVCSSTVVRNKASVQFEFHILSLILEVEALWAAPSYKLQVSSGTCGTARQSRNCPRCTKVERCKDVLMRLMTAKFDDK